MFYPSRNEEQLKIGESDSYCAILQEPGVISIINENHSLVEPFGDLLDEAFLNFPLELQPSWDPFIQQDNDDVNSELL